MRTISCVCSPSLLRHSLIYFGNDNQQTNMNIKKETVLCLLTVLSFISGIIMAFSHLIGSDNQQTNMNTKTGENFQEESVHAYGHAIYK